MKGKRAYAQLTLQPGEYGQDWRGHWYAMTPTGLIANLGNHTVIEHDDRTITVSPSILVTAGEANEWHGWLELGVWRTA